MSTPSTSGLDLPPTLVAGLHKLGLSLSGEVLGRGAQGVVLDSELAGVPVATKLTYRGCSDHSMYDEDCLSHASTHCGMSTYSDDSDSDVDTLQQEAEMLELVRGHSNVVNMVDFVHG